ncbi:MAG: Alpha-L-fucosidase, partial [Frondihabitans sp.]|nr:Alpha-L-fucosidase [Frondihabitans sp.]
VTGLPVGWPIPMARFDSPHPSTTRDVTDLTAENLTVQVTAGRAPAHVQPNYLLDAPDPVIYDDLGPDEEGLVAAGMGFAVAVAAQSFSDGRARLLIAARDGFRGRTVRPSADLERLRDEASATVVAAAAKSTADLRDAHVADYRSFFDRLDLDLSANAAPDAETKAGDAWTDELFFHLGRYLLISSSRPGTQPATLQGIWNADVRPGWSSNYTTNINVEMNYWPAYVAGLADIAQPFSSFISELAEIGTETASTFYGARGWSVHHNSDIWGFSAPVKSVQAGDTDFANWPTGSLWLAAHAYELLEFDPAAVHDPAAVADIWRILSGAAEFALDLLEPYRDGLLVVSPSTSPEHDFVDAQGQPVSLSAGASMDQELVQETFTRTVLLHERGLAPDTDTARRLVDEVRTALEALRPPVIGEDGAILEWAEEWEPLDRGHRHLSHIYGLFPGASMDELESPDQYRAAKAALADRVTNGSGHTGWSQSWILCLAARTRDSDLVERSLDILTTDLTSESLLDLHPVAHRLSPAGFLFQIDGNFGGTAGVIEALVQSQSGSIRLLNALPKRWKHGALTGAIARGGHSVDVRWKDGALDEATITAGQSQEVLVTLPSARYETRISLADGTTEPLPVTMIRDLPDRVSVLWGARPGERLVVTSAERDR